MKKRFFYRYFRYFFINIFFSCTLSGHSVSSQESMKSLQSDIDDLVSITKISILSLSDNLEGIYSRPLENDLREKIKTDHHWDYIESNFTGPIPSIFDLEQNNKKVREIGEVLQADAFIIGKIVKTPKGVNIRLNLFLTKDGKLFAQQDVESIQKLDIASLKETMIQLWSQIKSQIPYEGMVLSRQGQRVTINLGKKDGVKPEMILNATQILQLKRHPKFDFLIGVEQAIIGKIKIIKVDDTLSFGQVVFEKEKQAVVKGTKLNRMNGVTYLPNAFSTDISDYSQVNSSLDRSIASEKFEAQEEEISPVSFNPDNSPNQVVLAESSKNWVPRPPPMFGQIGARLGLGQFNGNMALSSAGSISSTNYLYPSMALEGELWITSEWTARAKLQQGIVPIDNPRSGSHPKKLSQSLTQTDFSLGYVVYSGQNVWAARVEGILGFSNYRMYVDDTDLRGFTTMDFGGVKVGARGSFPLVENFAWSAGGYIYHFINPSLKESPVSSGDDNDASINQFGVLVSHKLSENIKIEGSLDFSIYSAKFIGSGTRSEAATSASQRHSSLSSAVYYLF